MQIKLNNKVIQLDEHQIHLSKILDGIAITLTHPNKSKPSFFSKLLFAKDATQLVTPSNLYIYGKVGRGKSTLVKAFFNDLAINNKLYLHFNDFMQRIHKEMHRLRQQQDSQDTILQAAQNILGQSSLLCLDEFQVEDAADAMLLSRIFTYIFSKRIAVIFTSNSPPEQLYRKGLQRESFLKFVNEILKPNCQIINLNGPVDYRAQYLRSLKKHYFYPASNANKQLMLDVFYRLSNKEEPELTELEVMGRTLTINRSYRNIALFDFKELCSVNLGPADYQAIARKFDLVFLFALPKLIKEERDEARRFIIFIDEVYENQTALLVSSDAKPEELYPDGVEAEAFKRTTSRLHEIMSEEYWQQSKISRHNTRPLA